MCGCGGEGLERWWELEKGRVGRWEERKREWDVLRGPMMEGLSGLLFGSAGS